MPEEVRVLFGGWRIHEESSAGAMGTPRRSRGPLCEAKVEVIGGPGCRGREREADQTRHSDRVDIQHPAQPR